MAPRSYKRDKIGRFAEVAGSSGGGSGSSGESSGANTPAKRIRGSSEKYPAGTTAAQDAKGKGVDKMWGVKKTGLSKDGKPVYDFSERAEYVDEKLTEWRAKGIDTQSLYKGKNGEYTASRRKKQEQLMEDLWQRQAEGVPNEGKALMAGGLGGSGKGYTLKNKLGIGDRGAEDGSNYFTINPDVIKEEMAKRGMIPNLDKRMTPMELSPLAHEEASEMAMKLSKRAYAQKKNVVWDFTMATPGSALDKRLKPMREAGYTDVKGVFVDVTVDKSIRQAKSRWENGLVRFGEGKGDGGRFLPSGATKENRPEGTKFRSKNRETFEKVKSSLDGYQVFDNEVGSSLVDRKNDSGMGKS
jgi:hypothetical protein